MSSLNWWADYVEYYQARLRPKRTSDFKRKRLARTFGEDPDNFFGIMHPPDDVGRAYLPDGAFGVLTFEEAFKATSKTVLPAHIGFRWPEDPEIKRMDYIYANAMTALQHPKIVETYPDLYDKMEVYDDFFMGRKPSKLTTFHVEARMLKECGSRLFR